MNLRIDSLDLAFGDTPVLRNLSLETGDTRVLAVVGPSGGGKSTLLRVLAGLLAPSAGSVQWDGKTMSFEAADLRRYRRTVGTVFQAYNLFPHLTALENIALPLREVHGLGREEARARALAVLEQFGLAAQSGQKPGTLSGGQSQRVAIARALSSDPQRLFLDEPTSALDPEMTYEVLEAIRQVREEGKELVLVTHEIGFARSVADEVAFLSDGRILERGSPEKVIESPESAEAKRFFEKVLRW